MSTESPRVMSALIYIVTEFGDAIEDVSDSALTTIRTNQVHTAMASTHAPRPALINIFTACAVLGQVIPSSTGDGVSATGEGTQRVYAGVTGQTGAGVDHTLVYIDAVADCILHVPWGTCLFGVTAK